MSLSYQFVSHFWDELVARPSGPLGFRFILQPAMAAFLAARDGVRDARLGRSPYFWTICADPSRRKAALKEGVRSVARVLVLGAVVDIIYQVIVFHGLRPLQTIVIAVLLAFVPYLIIRGPAARIAKRLVHPEPDQQPNHQHRAADGG